jgi:hypothetical protein
MQSDDVILIANVNGDFEGFDGETLFALSNGTYWLQDEYKYWYHYSYCPRVEVINVRGRLRLRVEGPSETVAVKQVTDVIRSKINGAFNGWDGSSTYTLFNGQVWQQSKYKYKYKYKYMPEVIVYNSGGGHVMHVAGTSAKVRRIE